MPGLWSVVLVTSIGLLALFGVDAAAQEPTSDTEQTPAAQSGAQPSTGVQVPPQPAPTPQPSASPAPPPPAASQPSPGQGGRSPMELDASAVIGSTVRNSEGKDIGRVSRLMIDPRDGRVTTVVIGIGGTFGIGETQLAVPWPSVKIGQDRQRIIVTVDQRLLDQAPRAERAPQK